MNETKAQLTDRWRRENREEEVARFRKHVREDCRATGLSRKESNANAWSEATRNFPPLVPPKPKVETVRGEVLIIGKTTTQCVAEWNADWKAAEVIEVGQPSHDLPECTDIDEDLNWTTRNFLVIVTRVIQEDRMYWEIDWSRAVTPAPSTFAVEETHWKLTEENEFDFRMRAPIRWWDDE